MKPHIEITLAESSQIATVYRPFNGSTIHVGMMFASAARVVAQSFRQELGLPESEDAAILAQIVRVFNNDITMGSMGETATLEDLTKREQAALEYEQKRATETDADKHAWYRHPDYEYQTTSGPRKAWWNSDVPPEGDGWERNTDAGREGWERFDYHEESYWRRRKTTP